MFKREKKWWNYTWLSALVSSLVLCSSVGCNRTSQNSDVQPVQSVHGEETADRLQESLRETVERMLSILESGNPEEFLELISRDGVTFGIDWPDISPGEIQREFSLRRGTYCILFDTECAQREDEQERARAGAPPPGEPLLSFRDRLKAAKQRRVKVWVSPDPAGLWGEGVVTLSKEPTRESSSQDLQFTFSYESKAWKLRAVVYH